MTMHRVWAYVCLALIATGCGGGTLTLTEYSDRGAAVVAEMEERIGALDAELEDLAPSVEGAESYWERRLRARADSVEGLDDLEPPVAVAELHDTGMELYLSLVSAEEALASRVSSFETATTPDQWWETPEGEAVRAVDAEILLFCLEFQASYDATIDRLVASDVPWIPREMKEIVRIDVGC